MVFILMSFKTFLIPKNNDLKFDNKTMKNSIYNDRKFFTVEIKTSNKGNKKFFMHTFLDIEIELADWASFNGIENYSIKNVTTYDYVTCFSEKIYSTSELLELYKKGKLDLEKYTKTIQKNAIIGGDKYFITVKTIDEETLYFYVEEESYIKSMKKITEFLEKENKQLKSSKFVAIDYYTYSAE